MQGIASLYKSNTINCIRSGLFQSIEYYIFNKYKKYNKYIVALLSGLFGSITTYPIQYYRINFATSYHKNNII